MSSSIICSLIIIMILSTVLVSRISANVGFISIDGQSRATWYSDPFDHECLLCPQSLVKHTGFGDVSIVNRNCSVECLGRATEQHRNRSDTFKRVQVQNPFTGENSECLVGVLMEDIFCATVSIHVSGVRKLEIGTRHRCQRKNYRYYLPRSKCDETPHYGVGEESCEEACVNSAQFVIGQGSGSKSRAVVIDVERVRAKFRVCYEGRVTESYRVNKRTSNSRLHKLGGRYWDFCRAEMTPCSLCFRWGNWTVQTPCSRTCGSLGTATFYRPCEVKEKTEVPGAASTYRRVLDAYCKAHFGGHASKTEPCGTNSRCPEWSEWGSWSGCPTQETATDIPSESATSPAGNARRRKCDPSGKKRDTSRITNAPESSKTDSTVGDSILSESNRVSADMIKDNPEPPLTLLATRYELGEIRSRQCLYILTGAESDCLGNSTEYRKCDAVPTLETQYPRDIQYSTPKPELTTVTDEDCIEDVDGQKTNSLTESFPSHTTIRSTTSEITSTAERGTTTSIPDATVHQSHVREKTTTKPDTKLLLVTSRKFVPPRPKNNFTLEEDGFTSVLTDYAPALIAGLLIFIVLLLIALIAVCGTRIMQKNRNTGYDITSPSFSAGTVGSIPSGLVHSFSHTLGLRSGSGTFGRSGSTINGVGLVSDALSSRGSCRSMASATSGPASKMVSLQQQTQKRITAQPQANASGKARLVKPAHQNSPHAIVPLSTGAACAPKANSRHTNAAMDIRKPSSSSLLSNSSASCTSPSGLPPNSCSFQPLPPIPLDQVPHPVSSEEISAFRRGTGRSSSLTPIEHDHGARRSRNQARSESVGGRVYGKSHMSSRKPDSSADDFKSNSRKKQKFSHGSLTGNRQWDKGRHDHSTMEAYCRHACDEKTCGGTPNRFHKESRANGTDADKLSSENEYWSVTRAECLDSGTDSSENVGSVKRGARGKGKQKGGRESIPMMNMTEKPTKNGSASPAKADRTPQDDTEMVNNVLYAVATNVSTDDIIENNVALPETKEYSMPDLSSSGEGSVRSHLGSCGENAERPSREPKTPGNKMNDRFYNTIELDDSSRGSDADASTNNEDDYDHLCDQFGAPYIARPKTKYPGTMTSLHQLRQPSSESDYLDQEEKKSHDYECIEFDENLETEDDFCCSDESKVIPSMEELQTLPEHNATVSDDVCIPARTGEIHGYINTQRNVPGSKIMENGKTPINARLAKQNLLEQSEGANTIGGHTVVNKSPGQNFFRNSEIERS